MGFVFDEKENKSYFIKSKTIVLYGTPFTGLYWRCNSFYKSKNTIPVHITIKCSKRSNQLVRDASSIILNGQYVTICFVKSLIKNLISLF